jgi:hypothetical protein
VNTLGTSFKRVIVSSLLFQAKDDRGTKTAEVKSFIHGTWIFKQCHYTLLVKQLAEAVYK